MAYVFEYSKVFIRDCETYSVDPDGRDLAAGRFDYFERMQPHHHLERMERIPLPRWTRIKNGLKSGWERTGDLFVSRFNLPLRPERERFSHYHIRYGQE